MSYAAELTIPQKSSSDPVLRAVKAVLLPQHGEPAPPFLPTPTQRYRSQRCLLTRLQDLGGLPVEAEIQQDGAADERTPAKAP